MLEEVGQEEVLDFLIKLTNGNKQSTKRNRYSTLSSFYNFTINTASPELTNHCTTPIIKKIFRRATCIQWKIIDKETIDEIIFRTMNTRNRIIMELMARGGMRIGEVLKLFKCISRKRKPPIGGLLIISMRGRINRPESNPRGGFHGKYLLHWS